MPEFDENGLIIGAPVRPEQWVAALTGVPPGRLASKYTIPPGMLIAFPSDARYLHAARPVTSGVRYGLVSWAAVVGSSRVQKQHSEIIRI